MLKQILENLKYGEPWKLINETIAVVPLLQSNTQERLYRLLQEVKDQTEIIDTGSISEAKIKNNSPYNIFTRKGTLLKGNTQNRGVVVGTIVLSNMDKILEIQCIHASSPIRSGAVFYAQGIAPRHVESSFMNRASQGETWMAASYDVEEMSAMSATPTLGSIQTDNLIGAMEEITEFREDIEKALEQIPADLETQVGIAIIDINGVLGIEFFDHPDSWKAFSQSVTRNYADILTKPSNELFTINTDKLPDAINAFIEQLDRTKKTVVDETTRSTTYAIESSNIVGEYTVLDDNLIHLIVKRNDKPKTPRSPHVNYTPYINTIFTADNDYYDDANRWTTAIADNYLQGKGAYQLLNELKPKPKTWTQLHHTLPISTATLTKRLNEAQTHHLIAKTTTPQNGKTRYALTPKGRKLHAQLP